MWASDGHKNCWGSNMLLAQSYKAKVMSEELSSTFSNPCAPRSRLGCAEFHCITLQETQGTKRLCKRMMDSKVCLKMAAVHGYGFPPQQKVGKTPDFHSVDITSVTKTGFSG